MTILSNLDLPKTGDIYLVKFHPGYAAEFQKYRPAVIVSGNVSQIDKRFALIAPLTTNLKILKSETEFMITNSCLEKTSLLLCWYLWTIDSTRLVKKLGTLSAQDVSKMQTAIRNLVL